VRACASAPARGGSSTTASSRASSSGRSGRRKRSRASVVIRLSPVAPRQPASSAASIGAEPSTAWTSAARPAAGRRCRSRRRDRRCGPRPRAPRAPPRRARPRPRRSAAGRRRAGAPRGRGRSQLERRAALRHRLALDAEAREVPRLGHVREPPAQIRRSSGLPSARSTSSPAGPTVTVRRSPPPRAAATVTRAASAGLAAVISGTSTRQSGVSTSVSERRPWKPSSTVRFVRRAASTARRRVAGGTVTTGAIATASPRAASARSTMPRFHAATKASEPCCSTQPPQVPKCGQGGATRSGDAARISTGASTPPSATVRAHARPAARRARAGRLRPCRRR
jgi:hypothetical protein